MTTGRINQITIFMSYKTTEHKRTHMMKHARISIPSSISHALRLRSLCLSVERERTDTTHAVLFSDGKPKVLMVFQCAPRALPPCVQVHTGETAPELSVANSQIVFLKDTTTKEDAPGINQTRSLGRASSVWGADVA